MRCFHYECGSWGVKLNTGGVTGVHGVGEEDAEECEI